MNATASEAHEQSTDTGLTPAGFLWFIMSASGASTLVLTPLMHRENTRVPTARQPHTNASNVNGRNLEMP